MSKQRGKLWASTTCNHNYKTLFLSTIHESFYSSLVPSVEISDTIDLFSSTLISAWFIFCCNHDDIKGIKLRLAIRSLFVSSPPRFLSNHSLWIFRALIHLAATYISLHRHLYISPNTDTFDHFKFGEIRTRICSSPLVMDASNIHGNTRIIRRRYAILS